MKSPHKFVRRFIALSLFALFLLPACKGKKDAAKLISRNEWSEACALYERDPYGEYGLRETEFDEALENAVDARITLSAWSPERLEAFFMLPPPDPYCSSWGPGALSMAARPEIALSQHMTPAPTSRFAALDVRLSDPQTGMTGAKLELAAVRLRQAYDRDPTSSLSPPDTSWNALFAIQDGAPLSNPESRLDALFSRYEETTPKGGQGGGSRTSRRRLLSIWRGRFAGGSPPPECKRFGYAVTKVGREERISVSQRFGALARPCAGGDPCTQTVLFERGLGDFSTTPPRWIELDWMVTLDGSDDAPSCTRRFTTRIALPEAETLRESIARAIPDDGILLSELRAHHTTLPDCLRYERSCDDQQGMTRALCWNTGGCARGGQCEPGEGGKGCVAHTKEDCVGSDYCQTIGHCTLTEDGRCDVREDIAKACGFACHDVGACEAADRPTRGYECKASEEVACKESFACRYAGRCVVDLGACAVSSDEACASSLLCKERGWCARDDSVCHPTLAEHCASSTQCARSGACDLIENRCAPTAADHCKSSALCREEGRCTLLDGTCVVGGDRDCAESLACKTLGRCSAAIAVGVCAASR